MIVRDNGVTVNDAAPHLLFLFDMDEVLYSYDWRARMAGMTELTGHDLDELRRRWWNDEGEWRAEAGGFADGDEYLAAFRLAMGCHVDEADWARIRGGAMSPIPHALEAVRIAATAGRVALLTNNGPLAGRHIRTWAPEIDRLFGAHVDTTSNFGARKPDPEVFRRACAHHGYPPERTFFADDQLRNVEGARSIGITAVHVTPETDLRVAVREFIAANGREAGLRSA
jgi:putative hydrolase of the HAD superfamily